MGTADTEDRAADALRRLATLRRESNAASSARQGDLLREALKAGVAKRIRTTMVGALAQVEARLGVTPGSPVEPELAALLGDIKNAIFNLGNGQIRAAVSEIDTLDVSVRRYQYDSYPGRPNYAVYGLNPDGSLKRNGNGR